MDIVVSDGKSYRFLITDVLTQNPNYYVVIRNEGDSTHPFGSRNDVTRLAADQVAAHRFVNIATATGIRISSPPRPVASMVQELPLNVHRSFAIRFGR